MSDEKNDPPADSEEQDSSQEEANPEESQEPKINGPLHGGKTLGNIGHVTPRPIVNEMEESEGEWEGKKKNMTTNVNKTITI